MRLILILLSFSFFACNSQTQNKESTVETQLHSKDTVAKTDIKYDTKINTIHIIVALCDNKYQGIVPVPKKIGNGQDPKNNLYWGTAYGIKTFFKNSKDWQLVNSKTMTSEILERVIFKHKSKGFYIIADAYDGKYIKKATQKFLESSAGISKDTVRINDKTLGIEGNAKLVAYIGHDGLMDFQLSETYKNTDGKKRDVILLACYSKDYFSPHLQDANVNPLVWTMGLMAPEAYTIHDAIAGYVNGESNEQIRTRAAKAYSKYQKCSLKASKRLLTTE